MLHVSDLPSATETLRHAGHEAAVTALVAARDGSLFSAAADGAVRAWSPAPALACTASLSGHTAAVTALALSADEGRLFSVSLDGTVRRWCGHAYGPPTDPLRTPLGHPLFRSGSVTFPRPGRPPTRVRQGRVRARPGRPGPSVHPRRPGCGAVQLPAGAAGGQDDPVRGRPAPVDRTRGRTHPRVVRRLRRAGGHPTQRRAPRSAKCLWRRLTERVACPRSPAGACAAESRGHDSRVTALAVSRTEELLASASDDGSVRLLSADTLRCRAAAAASLDCSPVTALALSKDSAELWTGSADGRVRRFRLGPAGLSRVACLNLSLQGVVGSAHYRLPGCVPANLSGAVGFLLGAAQERLSVVRILHAPPLCGLLFLH